MSPRTLLSPEQRARLFAVPTSPAEMARHYVLSAEDLMLVRAKRRTVNRLGLRRTALPVAASRPGAWSG